jgi:hypothetical protein
VSGNHDTAAIAVLAQAAESVYKRFVKEEEGLQKVAEYRAISAVRVRVSEH